MPVKTKNIYNNNKEICGKVGAVARFGFAILIEEKSKGYTCNLYFLSVLIALLGRIPVSIKSFFLTFTIEPAY